MATPAGWHKEDIKAAVRKKGITMRELARRCGLSEASLNDALNRPVKCGEIAIAQFLDVPLHELWPERWTQNGLRIRPRYAHKYNAMGRISK